MSQRRLENALLHAFGLIIPQGTENTAQRAAQSAQDIAWRQEQEYSRQFSLHSSMTKIEWICGFRDSRKFPRVHYRLTSRA